MTQILRMSNLYAPTLKEDPSDADIDSARLLLRAGMLRKAASPVCIPTCRSHGARFARSRTSCARKWTLLVPRKFSCRCCSRRSCGRKAGA